MGLNSGSTTIFHPSPSDLHLPPSLLFICFSLTSLLLLSLLTLLSLFRLSLSPTSFSRRTNASSNSFFAASIFRLFSSISFSRWRARADGSELLEVDVTVVVTSQYPVRGLAPAMTRKSSLLL
jgi:hypothetical protein